MERRDVILLTSSIVPMICNRISDPKTRLQQYIHSLMLWPTTNVKHIVYCDNSGSDLDFSEVVLNAQYLGSEIEVLIFKETESYPKDYKKDNYGFYEHKIIQYALDNSVLMRQHESFYKVTGRLFVENFNKIQEAHMDDDAVFMKHAVKGHLDTKFFKMSISKYRELISVHLEGYKLSELYL